MTDNMGANMLRKTLRTAALAAASALPVAAAAAYDVDILPPASPIAQQIYEEVGLRGAKVILPVFEARKGMRGRLSIQTNPQWYRDADRLVNQAAYFHGLAPNIQVKLPVTT